MKRYLFVIQLIVIATFAIGCNDNSRLFGKVTFTDGNPATHGMVLLTKGDFQARGEIQKDGTFVVGSAKAKDGLPKGEYKVFVAGIDKPAGLGKMGFIPVCDTKYESPDTSGLTCTVPAPKNKFDIVLEPHPKNYP